MSVFVLMIDLVSLFGCRRRGSATLPDAEEMGYVAIVTK